jgi:protoheme ferro-lyase
VLNRSPCSIPSRPLQGPVDALLVLSFGGPEGLDEVRPFLENVVRGRGVPPERLDAVEEHYRHFGGVSPLNARNRDLIAAVREAHGSAGVLRQPQLAPAGRGHRRRDGP